MNSQDRRTAVRLRLGRTARRIVLVAHLLSTGSWFGADLVLATLVGVVLLTPDPRDAGAALLAVVLFAVPTVSCAGAAALVTGVVLAVGSGRGLLRHWWVVIKLAITVLMLLLVPIGLAPTLAQLRPQAVALLDGRLLQPSIGALVYPPVVAPTLLVVATVLAVVRPWGLVRGPRRPSDRLGS